MTMMMQRGLSLSSISSSIPSRSLWLLISMLFVVQQHQQQGTVVDAYKLFGNGKIYTVNKDQPWVDAVAIDGTKIVAVGTEEEIRQSLQGQTEEVYYDLGGRMMLPGFQDSHLHAVEAGVNNDENFCYIDEFTDLYDVPYFFKDNICANGGKFGGQGWILGSGLDISYLKDTVDDFFYDYPIKVLDDEFPNTPIVILDSLGHGAVVNSKAMELVGYDKIVGDPPGGKIDRDPDTGKPTGIVRENAQQVFRNAAFPPTVANQQLAYDSLLASLGALAGNGITTVSDAGGFWLQAQTEAWARAEEEGVLTVRASNALYIYPEIPIAEQLNDLTSRYSNDPNKLVRFNQAKIYVDGILSLATSALKQPYQASLRLDEEDELGFEYFGDADNLNNVARILSNEGFQLHFHVTGDRGAQLALDAIEQANQSPGPHRLTHCYLVADEDIGRFKELNAVADFQLAASSLTKDYTDFLTPFIGSTRSSKVLPAAEIHNTGALVVLTSDWDADSLSPLVKLKGVLTRKNGTPLPDLDTAIRMLTINPAILLHHDETTGTIEVGKEADLVIISENLFDLEPKDIDKAYVVATIFRGEPVHDPEGILGEAIGTQAPQSSAYTSTTINNGNSRSLVWYSFVASTIIVVVLGMTI